MKRFFCKFTAFALALFVPCVGYFAWVQAKPAMFANSLMGSAWYKQDLLQNTQGARIIIAGGSSAPYGVVSAQMQEASGMPCINIGITAYLGIDFYFSQMQKQIHEGDIVIIAPEYTMLENSISYSTVWTAAENYLQVLTRLPLSYWPHMIGSYHLYATQKLDLLKNNGEPALSAQQSYVQFGFGAQGDILTPRVNILEQLYNTQDTRTVSADILSEEFVKSINRFAAYAASKGARVYLTYAPFNRLALAKETPADGVSSLDAALRAKCKVPYLGNLADGVMDENLFFDSNNHLNTKGAVLRTDALIQDLHAAGAFN